MPDSPRIVVEMFMRRTSDGEPVAELFTDDAVITVPGARFERTDAPGEFLAFLDSRYEWVDKTFDRWIEVGPYVVSVGTLYGVDNDGDEFEGVRYVDVYEVRDGAIERVDILNDLAVAGVV